MSARKTVLSIACVVSVLAGTVGAAGGRSSIDATDLRQWLTYLASDELEGRAVYTEGLGLAAGYIQSHLQEWGAAPRGGDLGYFQRVKVLSVRSTSHSTVTVKVGRESRTFKDGEGISFPKNIGAKRRFTVDRIEFAGYGLDAPGSKYSDLAGKDYRGAAVVYLGTAGPQAIDSEQGRRLLSGRGRWLTEQVKAVAAIGPSSPQNAQPPRPDDAQNGRPARPDFVTTQRLDQPLPPTATGDDAFFQFLFSNAPVKYEELKRKAEAREPLAGFRLDDVTITFNLDTDYDVLRTQLTQNVVAVVEGSDPRLKDTYVAMGAHYDHVGYAESELDKDDKRPQAPGRVTAGEEKDRIWNGADDDGSGTVALMALARAFAQGQRPKRSLLFVWHAGEERGLLGSRYFADYPTVPMDRIVAQLNIDMIGRNRDNQTSESNTVYLVGSDRISSELHQINLEANRALDRPLTLDYEFNDPADAEQLYFRSDHYSYAAKGIPVIFFTTGLHPDYHANTDEVSRIEFPKLTRVTQLVYETAWRLANLDHPPVRDFKGPRAGRGTRE
ncbi:MAG: M20/M25/M40 family metallo-hydrolase [Acidobacteria bacterium]|nr:M20/M25/M40 family metallo-hydrolase [Acidobacteriota bacterium]